ncbi:MAG: ABC transporter substrate-binding protein [Acidobacteriota bacterium]
MSLFSSARRRRWWTVDIGWDAAAVPLVSRGLIALAVLLLLSACGAPQAQRAEADADRPPLRVALDGDLITLDPHLHSETIAHTVLGNIYDALVDFDDAIRVVPVLAERWDNPDDLTWRFHLRPDVTFHDGRRLSARDVVYSLQRASAHPRSKVAPALVQIERVRALDARVVEVRTRTPYPILLNKLVLVRILPHPDADADVDVDPAADVVFDAPIGTGPYRFDRLEPGRWIDLVRSDDPWRAPAHEPRVRFLFLADPAARIAALERGEADLIANLPSDQVETVNRDPALAVAARSSLFVTYLDLNPAHPPLDDVRVRRAISLAIDRAALVREQLHGQGQPLGQMVSPDVFGHVAEIASPARDAAAARSLLAEAGHPDGLDLEIETRLGRPVAPLPAQLAEAGIRVQVERRPWSEMYQRITQRRVTAYLGGFGCTSGDASDLFDHKVHTPDPARGYGVANISGHGVPALDALIEAANGRLDMVARRAVLRRATERLHEEAHLVPLFMPYDLYGLRADLIWTPRPDGRIVLAEARRAP